MRKLLVAGIAALGMLALAAPAQAASLTGPTGSPSRGGTVSFEASVGGGNTPKVDLICRQAGVTVFYDWRDVSRDNTTATFTLTSANWTSGSADCQADLYVQKVSHGGTMNDIVVLDSVTFTASG